jgi:signal transduction histidine kinase
VKGTGVGLAVVRHIARGHGGEVTLDSRAGAGTTFTILVPALDMEERVEGPALSERTRVEGA